VIALFVCKALAKDNIKLCNGLIVNHRYVSLHLLVYWRQVIHYHCFIIYKTLWRIYCSLTIVFLLAVADVIELIFVVVEV